MSMFISVQVTSILIQIGISLLASNPLVESTLAGDNGAFLGTGAFILLAIYSYGYRQGKFWEVNNIAKLI